MINTLAKDETYCRNMAALFAADARLAQRIDECPEDPALVVEASKRGPGTVSIRSGDRPIYLHSKVDPDDEARRWAEVIEMSEDFCYVVGGWGLGHHIRALATRLRGEAFLIVTEPNLALLRASLETLDLADLFANDKCIVLTRPDKSEIQGRLEPHNTLMMMGAQFVAHAPSDRVNGEFQAQMRKLLADHMTYCRMCLVTLVANSKITCTNIANNLPRYLATPPIDELRERFKGKPAIVVSAGPSLNKNIDQLASLQDKAIIIAVQTTFKPLLQRGIVPHFVTALDYHEISRRYFEGIDQICGTGVSPVSARAGRLCHNLTGETPVPQWGGPRWLPHLIAEPKASWHVLDLYRGPISILDNPFARLIVGDELAGRAGLKAGATVAHLAFYLAVYMGCEPIILVGQDLGYTNHVYYAPGVPLHDLWRPEFNRFCTVEMREWERLTRTRRILIKTKDVEGNDIYTDEQLFTYLQQFEGDFAAVPGRVIDATEGGVRKAGARIMSLAEAAKAYCERPLDVELLEYHKQWNWHDRSRLEAGRAEIQKRLDETQQMVDLCGRLSKLLLELEGLTDNASLFNRRLTEVDALRLKVQACDRTYRLVSSLSQHAELQRFSADRRIELAELKSAERAKRQLERDRKFMQAMIEGAATLREVLEASLARFDEALKSER